MMKYTVSKLTLRIFFPCLLVFNTSVYSSEKPENNPCPHEQNNSSAVWNAINHPIGLIVITYVANKTIIPLIDPVFNYASNGCYNFYFNYVLTSEQREKMQQEQQEKDAELFEEYQKAAMKHTILFTKTERGEKILLREKELENRHNALLVKADELKVKADALKVIATEREESSNQVKYFEELRSITSDLQLQHDLQKKRDDEIRKWMNSR